MESEMQTFSMVFAAIILCVLGGFLAFVSAVASWGLLTFGGNRREWLIPIVFAWGAIILCYYGYQCFPFTLALKVTP